MSPSELRRDNTVDHIVSTLLDAEIPVAPVKTIPQAAQDPHLWEREMLVKMPDALAGEIHVPGATIKMSKTPGRVGHVPTAGRAHRRNPVGAARLRRERRCATCARGQDHRGGGAPAPIEIVIPAKSEQQIQERLPVSDVFS